MNSKLVMILSAFIGLIPTLVYGGALTLDLGPGKDERIVVNLPVIDVDSDGTDRAVITCDGVQWLGNSGEPRIPWQVITLLLPPNADLASLSCDLEQGCLMSIRNSL